jgi:hypothetical protein
VASFITSIVQRRPVLAVMLLVAIALVSARCHGPHGPVIGYWDGPI